MNRFNNNDKTAWSGHRPDTFANGASRRPNFNIRRNEVFQRQPIEDDELEGRPHGDSHHDDTVSGKLDRLLDKMDKFDLWRDEADRRFENLDPCLSRKTEPPLGFDDGDEGVYEDVRRGRSGDGGYRSKNADWGFRDTALEDRGRRGARDGGGSGWDFHGNRGGRAQFRGYPQQFDKPTSYWDPPHRYQASAAGFAKNKVTMKPPRFDGSEATNWISRVQYYFDHLMIPDAQRLHYAVMLFDPPASEWVFNYGANIECVTWQEFLEDVRRSFDRQRDRYRREGRIHMGSCWDPPRYQQHRRPIGGHDQPPLGPPSRWDPPDNRCPQTLQPSKSDRQLSHRTAPLSAVATHPPQQSSRFIDSGKQRGLPNTPSLKVCSPDPAHLAAVSDYNEKWRIYRLKHSSLLAELSATFEENIDDRNLVEDVPNNAVHNGGATLDVDVPIDEPLEEIVKTDNTPRQVLVGAYDEKIDDLSVPTHKELEMREATETLLEKENKAEALRSSLEPKEKDFSVLMEKPSERESMENQSLVNDILAGFDMKKKANQEEMEEKRRLWEDELKLNAEELGKTGDAHFGSHALACVYVDLNVGDVPSMTHRSTSLDTDARLIPPCNDAPYFSVLGSDKGRHSTVRYVFDPGGDASLKLLLSTLVVGLWFPP